MAVGVDGQAARAADGPARLHEGAGALHEGRGLGAREAEARLGGVRGLFHGFRRALRLRLGLYRLLALFLLLLVLLRFLRQLLGDDEDAIGALVVGDAERANHPRLLHRLEQCHVGRQRARLGEIGEQLREILAERAHLLLLELERDHAAALAGLKIEHTAPGGPHRAGGEEVGRLEVVRGGGHQPTRFASSPPVEFTVSTAGPLRPYAIALIEAVAIMMRWKRSSGVPRAWATAVLMGSAWDTATTVSPGWRATRGARVVVMRVWISTNDSPPGKRKPLG